MDAFKENNFQTPHEEIDYLRKRVAEYEKTVEKAGSVPERTESISHTVKAYDATHHEKHLHENYALPENEVLQKALQLSPESHDVKIEELISSVKARGVKNTLRIVEKMKNPHVADDFHRALVAYLKAGFEIIDLDNKDVLAKSLKMTLYEVTLPERKKEEQRGLKEIVSSMEQLYASMLSIEDSGKTWQAYMTLELALPNIGEEAIFFVSVPDNKKDLFEAQLLAIFPDAKLYPQKNDYNIFNEMGVTVAAYATSSNNPIYPIKTYEQFDHDPMNGILNSFSKVDKEGEGAAIQIIFKPAGKRYINKYAYALDKIQRGVDVSNAIDIPDTVAGDLWKGVKDFFASEKKKDNVSELKSDTSQDIEYIRRKISSPIVETNIRVVASSRTLGEAESILADIQSSFNQFNDTKGNGFEWKKIKGNDIYRFLRQFSYRTYTEEQRFPLSLSELTTVIHFHTKALDAASSLKYAKSGTGPAPADMPESGLFLGVNRHASGDTNIYMQDDDRLRHLYVIGQTGTGKTTFMKELIIQDIKNGEGVCMIDPHGSDIQDVLNHIPPERFDDVIYFDPSNTARPMALNMLEYDPRFPEQKTFVVNELLSIFNKLFDMKVAGGPMFEQYFRNSVLLVMEDPESGNTLLDVSRVLADKQFRDMKLSRCKNPIVVQYWREVAEKAGGEASLQNVVPYITSKFDVFLSNDIMRPVIAQEKSSFNFREIMDSRKILLVNLSKGRLGDINAHLIGLILVGKILMSALSRVDSFGKDLPPFYLYIDEFQNITTDSISAILSEARKYKLSLAIAHQFIAQLEDNIKNAVFGNVGSIVSFRVGAEDAEYLEKQFSPVFEAKDIMNIENRNAYVKMLVNGSPVRPFNMEVLPPPVIVGDNADTIKQLSFTKFGRPLAEVEEEIMSKYRKEAPKEAMNIFP